MRGSERFAERERESKPDSAVFEWLGARARARARAANAERVPAGMFSLIADSGVILFVSGVSNLITRYTKVSPNQLIPINQDCFDVTGSKNPKMAGKSAKVKAVNLTVDSIVNNNLSPQQQVLALREALVHTRVRILSKSAGVIDNTLFDTFEYVLKNTSEVISLARKTAREKGRTNNDKRSLVESIVMVTLQPRGIQQT